MNYSVILPFFNEEEVVEEVVREVAEVLSALPGSLEIVAVNDGSSDGTGGILRDLSGEIPNLRILTAEKRGGQSAALFYGGRRSVGDVILTLDGDGQNDPADLLPMTDLLGDVDLVVGVRQNRRDIFIKRISSRVANGVRRRVLHDRFRDVGCGVRVIRREVFDLLPFFTSLHRYIPILASTMGFTVKEFPVNHRPRRAGRSKYGTWDRLIIGLCDLRGVRWLKRRIVAYSLKEEEKGGRV